MFPSSPLKDAANYQAFDGQLRGCADVVFESAQGVELIDYKTGKIFDEDEDGNCTVKEKYWQQLHLYAAMHQDCTGTWPVKGHLVPGQRQLEIRINDN